MSLQGGFYLTPTCGTVDTVIVPNGNHRRYLFVSNPTQDALYIAFGMTATVGADILIPPNTRGEKFYREELGPVIDMEVHGIFGNTAGTLAIIVGYDK